MIPAGESRTVTEKVILSFSFAQVSQAVHAALKGKVDPSKANFSCERKRMSYYTYESRQPPSHEPVNCKIDCVLKIGGRMTKFSHFYSP